MKRYLALLVPILVFFSSCQKNEYVDTVENRTIIVNIAGSSWRTSDNGKTYYTTIDMPELTNEFNERGGVLVYLTFGNRTYEQLPEVYDGDAYSFTTSPGQIEIAVQKYNGTSFASPPTVTTTAKIILVESQF